MTLVETLLVFVVAPLVVLVLTAALVMLPALKNRDRYKPGKTWGHAPVWYEPHPVGGAHDAHDDEDDQHAQITTGDRASALAIGAAPHASTTPGVPARTASGGARGTW